MVSHEKSQIKKNEMLTIQLCECVRFLMCYSVYLLGNGSVCCYEHILATGLQELMKF